LNEEDRLNLADSFSGNKKSTVRTVLF